MKCQKLIIILMFVALVVTSFSVYGANEGLTNQNGVESKDPIVKKIANVVKALQKDDERPLDEIIDQNVVWTYEGLLGIVPFAGTYTGIEGIKDFCTIYFNTLENTKSHLRYYLHQGNIIHLHWIEEGIAASTRKKYIMETVQIWELNDQGKVVKMRWYNDTYAMYNVFQDKAAPALSLAQHPADYHVDGDGPVDALPVIQQYYNYFAVGDLESIINSVTPNFICILAGPDNLTQIAGTWYGPQGFLKFFEAVFQNERYNLFKPVSFCADGNRVDVEFQEEIVILKTGRVLKCNGLHSFVVNSNSQLVNFRSYNDTYNVAWGYDFN